MNKGSIYHFHLMFIQVFRGTENLSLLSYAAKAVAIAPDELMK